MNLRGVLERLTQVMFIRNFIQKRSLCCHLSSPSKVLGESMKCEGLGIVANAYHSSYLGGRNWRIVV
jgi:hypothetical protein